LLCSPEPVLANAPTVPNLISFNPQCFD